MHTILIGDAREQLATIPAGTVQTCVTSPPYYGLRNYGHDGQIGLESTVEDYVSSLVDVFREVRRVLRDDGTLWLNLGDSYASSGISGMQSSTARLGVPADGGRVRMSGGVPGANPKMQDQVFGRAPTPDGLKPKDLIGVPWRVAFALQADGWYLRSEIIWHKPNPMPESVTDRPTKAHETVFLLSKSPRYYYDAAAIAEPATQHEQGIRGNHDGQKMPPETSNGRNGSTLKDADRTNRNKRSVWTISTRAYSGAHFAVFPPKLIEPCILAGTSERGQCRACGAPWVRVVERGELTGRRAAPGQPAHLTPQGYLREGKSRCGDQTTTTKGWAPSCDCDAGDPVPQTVLDPFAGSGTTGAVAELHGRHAVLIELNPDYRPLIDQRLAQRTIWQALTEVS